MAHIKLDRRDFLKGCCAAAAVGAAGPGLFFSSEANAATNTYDTIVHVFLRGGIDGLNLVLPISGADRGFYEQARPNIQVPLSGTAAALPLTLAAGPATVVTAVLTVLLFGGMTGALVRSFRAQGDALGARLREGVRAMTAPAPSAMFDGVYATPHAGVAADRAWFTVYDAALDDGGLPAPVAASAEGSTR